MPLRAGVLLLLVAGVSSVALAAAASEDAYRPGPDSLPQQGVPRGSEFELRMDTSSVFPGAHHRVTVYVPAQYHADKPACLYVGFDGLGFSAPIVFDNLIAQHAMPVTIAIGIEPARVDSVEEPRDPRFDRSAEFDGLGDDLARFVIDEVIPEVGRQKTREGLPILLSTNPDDRAAGGASTAAIAAFTLAWQRPDQFRRVFLAIGTFVGMRGGDRYPVIIRKTEPKPLRLFLQDGAHDEWAGGPEFGDWWLGNQTLASALAFAGYALEHAWGDGAHSTAQASSVFPQAMRWLWKDWPAPLTAGRSGNVFLQTLLLPQEPWRLVPAADPQVRALSLGSMQHSTTGSNGRVYSTDTGSGEVWLQDAQGRRTRLDAGLKAPTGIALSPDQLWLAVAESGTHWGYSYRVLADGAVDSRRRFYWFHVPDDADDSGAGGWIADQAGTLYSATRMGIQVFDRNGRVRAILPLPDGRPVSVAFGDSSLDRLYVMTADGRVYARKLGTHGIEPGSAPHVMPPWGAG